MVAVDSVFTAPVLVAFSTSTPLVVVSGRHTAGDFVAIATATGLFSRYSPFSLGPRANRYYCGAPTTVTVIDIVSFAITDSLIVVPVTISAVSFIAVRFTVTVDSCIAAFDTTAIACTISVAVKPIIPSVTATAIDFAVTFASAAFTVFVSAPIHTADASTVPSSPTYTAAVTAPTATSATSSDNSTGCFIIVYPTWIPHVSSAIRSGPQGVGLYRRILDGQRCVMERLERHGSDAGIPQLRGS